MKPKNRKFAFGVKFLVSSYGVTFPICPYSLPRPRHNPVRSVMLDVRYLARIGVRKEVCPYREEANAIWIVSMNVNIAINYSSYIDSLGKSIVDNVFPSHDPSAHSMGFL